MDGWSPGFPGKRRTYDEREDAARAPKRPRQVEPRLAVPPCPHAGGSGQRPPDYPTSRGPGPRVQRNDDGNGDPSGPRSIGASAARHPTTINSNSTVNRPAPGPSVLGRSGAPSRPGPPGFNRPPLPAGPRHSTGSFAPRPAAPPPTQPDALADAIIISDSSEDEAPLSNRRHTMPSRPLQPGTHMEGDTIVIDDSDDEPAPAKLSRPATPPPPAPRPAAANGAAMDAVRNVQLPAAKSAVASHAETGLASNNGGKGARSPVARTSDDRPLSTPLPSPSPPPSPPSRVGSHLMAPIRIGPPKGKRRAPVSTSSAARRRDPSPGPSHVHPRVVPATGPAQAHPAPPEADNVDAGSSLLRPTVSYPADSLARDAPPSEESALPTASVASTSNDGKVVPGVTPEADEAMDVAVDFGVPQEAPARPLPRPKTTSRHLSYYMQFYTAPARSVDSNGATRWTFVCKLCDTIRTVHRGELETEFVLAPKTYHLFSNFACHVRKRHLDYDPAQLRDVTATQRAEEWKSRKGMFTITPEGEWLLPVRTNRWTRQQPEGADTASSGTPAPGPPEQDPPPPPEAVEDDAEASATSHASIHRTQPDVSAPLVDPALMNIRDEDDWIVDSPTAARARQPQPSRQQSLTPTPPPQTPPPAADELMEEDPPLSVADPNAPSANVLASSSLRTVPRPSTSARKVNPFISATVFRSFQPSTSSKLGTQPRPSTSARKGNPSPSKKVHSPSRPSAKSKDFGAIERFLSPVKKGRPDPPPSAEASTSAHALPPALGPRTASGTRILEETRIPPPEGDIDADVFGPAKANDRGSSPPVLARSRESPAERNSETRVDTHVQQHEGESRPLRVATQARPLAPASSTDADPLIDDDMGTGVAHETAQRTPPLQSSGRTLPSIIASAWTSVWRRTAVAESVAADPAAPEHASGVAQQIIHTDSDLEDDATMQDDFDAAPDVPPSPPSRAPEPGIADTVLSATSAIGSDLHPALFAPAGVAPSASITDHVSLQEAEFQSHPLPSLTLLSNDDDTESDDDVPIPFLKQRRAERRAMRSRDLALGLPSASPAVLDGASGNVASPSAQETAAVAHERNERAQLVQVARALRWPAEEVDTIMYDVIDSLHEHNRRDPFMRQVFENVMVSNTLHDEPDAPPITVANPVNDDPCPPWEFYYTNKLYYGQNVRRGDRAKLKGCNCVGGCRPDSKTCSCLHRQYRYLRLNDEKPPRGFNYDEHGHVRYLDFPIFECNDACGCDETCMNRVVQRGRQYPVEIANTRDKGWGVFAKSDIPSHSFVGVYSGELITDRESHAREALYSLVGRSYLFAIEMWYLKNSFRRKYRKVRSDSVPLNDDEKAQPDEEPAQPDDEHQSAVFVVDAFHVGNFTRFLNHSCQPNCALVPVHINEPHLYKPFPCFFTEKAVKAGEELTFSYCGPIGDDEYQAMRDENNEKYQQQEGAGLQDQCQCGAEKCIGRLFTYSAGGDRDVA